MPAKSKMLAVIFQIVDKQKDFVWDKFEGPN